MQNDVVRWNAVPCLKQTENYKSDNNSNNNAVCIVRSSDNTLNNDNAAECCHIECQRLNVAGAEQQQHIAAATSLTNNANKIRKVLAEQTAEAVITLQRLTSAPCYLKDALFANNCDNNNDKVIIKNNELNFQNYENSFLLEQNKIGSSSSNSSKLVDQAASCCRHYSHAVNTCNSLTLPPTSSRHSKTCRRQVQKHQYQHQHQQQPQQQMRTFYHNINNTTNLTKFLLNCLQLFSAVVILCNFNNGFGFVGAATASAPASSLLTAAASASADVHLPYELDYEGAALSSGSANKIDHYTHTWAVHIPHGDVNGLADEVARDHGFVNMGKIFDEHYHFAHHKVSKRSLTPAATHQTRLEVDERVHWAKQQKAKSRRKRDFIRMRPSRTSSRALSLVDVVPLNDPKWPQMWYLNRGGGLDMNVIPAWKEGITGKGIVVTILDDGLESDHPDIEHNYDPDASYDVNSHDNDPMPHYDMTDSNRHGTRCAGEVAATANNTICAVGIAFGASVGGVRMLDGDVTDAVEARSLSLNPQHIDIYSASWGPDDDGKTVDGPGELASRAFIEGVTKGRSGKGSIFIWASGNGGRELDNCNCDGYTNSIWTLSISSATEEGHVPWYSEKCSSTLATTYSSGGQSEKQVVTTDLHHSCTVSHTGTSASAPLAAGIAALVLESNKNLTWRDLQHIVVRTAKPANLKDPTWAKNGVGRRVSHSFGYGLMDAAAMVKVARTWRTVPEQQRCEINAPHLDKVIPPRGHITLQLTVQHCSSVNYLEHVQAKITLTSQRRGDIQLYLRSPAGTKVTLLTSRVHDVSRSGFNQWPFMSVHTWGESPHGNWQLEIHNEGRYMAQITQWDLIFYGTEIPAQPNDPIHINPDQFSHDMVHNDIEYDASGQSRNMQQIGEASVHDKTNTSCVRTTIDQRCLECMPSTYLLNGRCFDECPQHTFVVVNKVTPMQDKLHNNFIMGINESESTEMLQSIDRRRRLTEADDMLRTSQQTRECSFCDKTCLRCYGPHNSQCLSCWPGSKLRRIAHLNESFCYVFAERSTGTQEVSTGRALLNGVSLGVELFLVIIIPLVIVVGFVIVCKRATVQLRRRVGDHVARRNAASAARFSADRVALLFADDEGEAEGEDIAESEISHAEVDFVDTSSMNTYRDTTEDFTTTATQNVDSLASDEEMTDASEDDLFDVTKRV